MKNNDDVVWAAITPREMFTMIEDFADGLLDYLREHGKHNEQVSDTELLITVSQQIMDIFNTMDIAGRVAIIIMLQGACAMYRVSCEQEQIPSCPPDRLN